MEQDQIAIVEIDEIGRLHIMPASHKFPYIYREAMEVHWDPVLCSLHSPVPREWTYLKWFQQIVSAASEQGCKLTLTAATRWVNIPSETKSTFLNLSSH